MSTINDRFHSLTPCVIFTKPAKMGIHAIMIINKAGGLIYNKDFGTGITKLTTNEYLVLAGTFHGYRLLNQDSCTYATDFTD